MLRLTQTKLARTLLVAVYVMAASTSGLFHQHAPGECADHGPAHACLAHGDHDHEHGDSAADDSVAGDHTADDSSIRPDGRSLADDDCAVCRFLGLASLPTAPVALPVMGNLVVAANPAEPRHESRSLELTLHSRAPPVAIL